MKFDATWKRTNIPTVNFGKRTLYVSTSSIIKSTKSEKGLSKTIPAIEGSSAPYIRLQGKNIISNGKKKVRPTSASLTLIEMQRYFPLCATLPINIYFSNRKNTKNKLWQSPLMSWFYFNANQMIYTIKWKAWVIQKSNGSTIPYLSVNCTT